MDENAIKAYWKAFLATLPSDSPMHDKDYTAEYFGDNPELANELGALIAEGTKTATCSALWEWEAEGTPLPKAGLITIVLDGSNKPLCIIETTDITIRPYNEVDSQFAYEEGEGDRSLEYWQEAH